MESEEIVFYINNGKSSIIFPIKGFQVYYVKPEQAGRVRIADHRPTGLSSPSKVFNEFDRSIEFLVEYVNL